MQSLSEASPTYQQIMYAKWIPVIDITLKEAGEWNGSSLGIITEEASNIMNTCTRLLLQKSSIAGICKTLTVPKKKISTCKYGVYIVIIKVNE